MTLRKQPASVVTGLSGEFQKSWAVVEYSIGDPTNQQPPTPMLITACKLHDVYTLGEPARNSEWRKHVTPDHMVLVQIHAIGTRQECQLETSRMLMARNPRPRGNAIGFDSFSRARTLLCSDGSEYSNQAEAARVLNLNQGALSRHLRGELRHVKGYFFTYKD